MRKRPVVFCANCKHSQPDPISPWQLRCHNPEVNRYDGWALSSGAASGRGTDCFAERKNCGWFSICGIKGKQYEAKQ
jgi:hypothetical protein